MVFGGLVGAVAGIKVDFRAAAATSAGATASTLVIVQGGIFVVVAVQNAWNVTNAWYELA